MTRTRTYHLARMAVLDRRIVRHYACRHASPALDVAEARIEWLQWESAACLRALLAQEQARMQGIWAEHDATIAEMRVRYGGGE